MAALIMVIVFIGKDRRGTIIPDALNYIGSVTGNSQGANASPSDVPLPNPTDMKQVESYLQSKYTQGYLECMNGAKPDSTGSDISALAALNDTVPGDKVKLPDTFSQQDLEQYVIQKYNEGYSSSNPHSQLPNSD